MDDHDDPRMAELLRRWGHGVRADGGPRHARPDPAALDAALAEVDAGIRRARLRRLWAGVPLAAAVVVALGWWFGGRGTGPLAFPGDPPAVLDVALANDARIDRGEPRAPLAPAAPLFLHYFAERPGFAIVLAVAEPAAAELLTPAPVPLSVDDEPMGPFALPAPDDAVGLFMVVTAAAPTAAQLARVIELARDAATRAGGEPGEALAEAFAAVPGLRALFVPLH